MKECEYCGQTDCDGVQTEVIDPFMQEIYGEIYEVLMCEGAYQQSMDDI